MCSICPRFWMAVFHLFSLWLYRRLTFVMSNSSDIYFMELYNVHYILFIIKIYHALTTFCIMGNVCIFWSYDPVISNSRPKVMATMETCEISNVLFQITILLPFSFNSHCDPMTPNHCWTLTVSVTLPPFQTPTNPQRPPQRLFFCTFHSLFVSARLMTHIVSLKRL